MADEETKEEPAEEETEGKDAPEGKGGKKKLIIIAAALLLVLGGGAGAYFFLFAGHDGEHGEEKGSTTAVIELPEPPILHEMASMMSDLKTDRCRSPFIKFKAVIEISPSYLPKFQEEETRILDGIQSFLRTQTRSQMVGRKGTDNLRAGILTSINRAIAPDKALNVLFRELVLQ